MTVGRRTRLRLIDHYDDELRLHNERLRAATGVRTGDRVLDIGCGAGQSTRDAARAAGPGGALGIDIAEEQLDRARSRTDAEGLRNVTYERGDAQIHPFPQAWFDVVISRFGTMFFADPVAAFTNIARAARTGARLVMMVWQSEDRNEWATAIRDALGADAAPASGSGAFSLSDPVASETILTAAGFVDVGFADVREPVHYGPDVEAALDVVRDMRMTKEFLARLDTAAAQRALASLRETLAAHDTGDGVLFASRAWIVTARRAEP